MKSSLQQKIEQKAVFAYSLLRTLHFSFQGKPLPLISNVFSGKRINQVEDLNSHLKIAQTKIESLLSKDAANIAAGIYPYSVINSENILKHSLRLPIIYFDAIQAALRKKDNQSKKFSSTLKTRLESLPEYYRRNFHFQTNGYLGERSAEIYEHQVEILFSGSAGAMRRLILPKLKSHFKMSNGKKLKFLEVGSGTGALTRSIALAFPDAEITCIDLSQEYLDLAKKRLSSFKNIKFIQGSAENTKLNSNSFDAVFSCFLFHELPHEIRSEVVSESHRVLKKNGFFGLVDSIQKNDDPEFNWALKQFPIDFHEPFFKDYINKPLGSYLEKLNFKKIQSSVGFLSKVVTSVK